MVESIKWHRLRELGTDSKSITGDWPQVIYIQEGIGIRDSQDLRHIRYAGLDKPAGKKFVIPYFKAQKKAKPTDFLIELNISIPRALIVSPRCKAVLDGFRLPEHEVFETKAIFSEEELPYYLYYFHGNDWEAVDFKRSVFEYKYGGLGDKPFDPDDNEYYMESWEEFQEKNAAITLPQVYLGAKTLVLDDSYDRRDMIRLRVPFLGLFINEALKNALIGGGITAWALQSQPSYQAGGIQHFRKM